MWVKIQHQMEVMNPIYMAPHMTTLTKMTILNIHFTLFCPMKGDGGNRKFTFGKRAISEWGSSWGKK